MELLASKPERCEALESPSKLNFTISLFLLVGILVSYLSQHYRIIARRSSEGISPYFVLLGMTSGTCAFANMLVLPTSRADMACCRYINGYECFAGLLGVLQVGMQWSCFTVILCLFLIYFPRDESQLWPGRTSTMAAAPTLDASSGTPPPSYRHALAVMVICILHAFLTAIFNGVIVYIYPASSQTYANLLGIVATMLAAIQYLPQLYTTWSLGTVGSLSIPMMLLQTPGSFLWAASLAARTGWEGWSIWTIFLVTGSLQGVLLAMGIVFELRLRNEKKLLDDGPREPTPELDDPLPGFTGAAVSSERTPLLREQSRQQGDDDDAGFAR